jgi:hypothetical protein
MGDSTTKCLLSDGISCRNGFAAPALPAQPENPPGTWISSPETGEGPGRVITAFFPPIPFPAFYRVFQVVPYLPGIQSDNL